MKDILNIGVSLNLFCFDTGGFEWGRNYSNYPPFAQSFAPLPTEKVKEGSRSTATWKGNYIYYIRKNLEPVWLMESSVLSLSWSFGIW